MTLFVTAGFYIQKARHFAKNKTIWVTFLCYQIRTLCITRFFIEFLKVARGGEAAVLNPENNALKVTFLYLKNRALCDTFYIQKPRHYALHLYMQKTLHFALHCYI